MVGFSKQSTGTLVDGGHRCFVKEHAIDSGDHQVMAQVVLHGAQVNPRKMTSGNDAGGQRLAVAITEVVDQVGLPGKDDGQKRFGILFKLGEGMKFGKNLQTQQRGFVDNQCDLHFFTGDPLHYLLFNPAGHVRS